ncbi:MAG: nucleoside deaminase [Bacteroidetes bacterium]|nr:tRNA-specific adenosine deaminase [Rhodothermaceae bacterium RA]RMH50321.1 MAG: nucleoside deaminase [Bacteroidota bacterium]
MTDRDFMQTAIEMAVENVRAGRGGPFAALVVRDGTIIGRGTNQVTTANDPTAHAEIVAIREACRALGTFQLTGCTLYTTCEPCPMCMGAVYWARPARVCYAATRADAAAAGFDDAHIYEELTRPPEARRIPMVPLLREEAQAPFDAWRAYPARIAY